MITKITKDGLNKIFEALSRDETEAANAYARLRESLIRFFGLKGDPDAESAADETLDRVAVKLENGAEAPSVPAFAFGIARFVFLERLRESKKNALAAEGYYEINGAAVDNSVRDERMDCYRRCFDSLSRDEQELLKAYFAHAFGAQKSENRLRLCEDYGVSLANLRTKVFRLRKRLDGCLKSKLGGKA